MNITIAVVYVDGTAKTRIDSECLVECAVEGQGSAYDLDTCRARLTEAFAEIHDSRDIDVLFPELGECI
jgi:hypothetical protein